MAVAAEAGRRPRRFHPRAGEPAARAKDVLPVPDELLAVAVWVGEAGPSAAPPISVHARERRSGPRPRRACSCATASRSRACSTCPGRRTIPTTGTGAASAPGRVDARRQARSRQRRRRDRRVRPWAVDASVAARGGAGNQGSRRRCAPTSRRLDVTEHLRRLRRPLRPGDADPGARRARRRPGTRRSRTTRSAAELRRARARLRRPPDAAHPRRAVRARASGSTSSARTSLHTGAHKLNNALGQAVLARRLGQAADRRRDGRWPARRRDRDRLRALRPRVRRLHGRRGHAPAGAERRADGPARRRGAARRVRHEDAEGGDERGDPRLDHQRRDDATT